MRSLFLIATVVLAYAHLRGWPEGLHPVLRACFAVLALVLGVGLWRRRQRPACSQARAIRAPRWPDYLAIGMGVLAVECLFLFFLSAVPPKAEDLALAVEETLLPEHALARAAATGPAGDSRHAGQISGNWLWNDQGERRLPLSTNAIPSNKPEVFFRPADRETSAQLLSGKLYIRAFALERYDDATWSPLKIAPETFQADPDGWIRLPRPPARSGPVLNGEIFHAANPSGQDVFTALQGAFKVELPQLRRIAPGILSLNPLTDPGRGYNYKTSSQSLSLDNLLESGALTAFELPEDTPPHLIELPENPDLRQALIDIAIKTQGPIESRLLALRKIMNEQFKYSLEVRNPDGRDPVLNFLLHERRGHCEFFATAGALLCRTLDIPARVAYGWTGGRYYDSQNLFMFRAREAHAWTEVYLKDVGWIVFDPTPPGALGVADFSIAPPNEKPPLDDDGIITYDTTFPGDGGLNSWTLLALGAGLALLPLSLLVLRLRRKNQPPPGTTPSTLLPASPGYLDRFRQACTRLGSPMPPGRTLRQQLAALARDDRAPAFAHDLLEYHYDTTYGAAPPDKSLEKSLARAIKRWT